MEYLSPSNFKRGNEYMYSQYSPLLGQLRKAIRKISQKYERECERLLDSSIPKTEFDRGHTPGNEQRRSPFPVRTDDDTGPLANFYYGAGSHTGGA
ncbi:hypothetical protein FBU59_007052, partial [Linderina macrospora]